MKPNDVARWDCFTCAEQAGGIKGLRVAGFNSRTVDQQHMLVAVTMLGKSHTMPQTLSWETFRANVLSGKWAPTTVDLEPPSIRSELDVHPDQRERFVRMRDHNFALINPILALGWGAFVTYEREAAIAQIIREANEDRKPSIANIKDLLIWIWRAGGNKMILGPDYTSCGSKSRKQHLQDAIDSGADPGTLVRRGRSIRIAPLPIERAGPEGRGGCAIPNLAVPVIEKSIIAYLEEKTKKEVIRLSLDRFRAPPWNDIKLWVYARIDEDPRFRGLRPTRSQVKWIGKGLRPTMDLLEDIVGSRVVALNYRAKNGDYSDVTFGAGSLYEADPHRIDVELVDDETLLPVGRSTLILAVDRASTYIAGFTVVTDNADFGYMGRTYHCAFSNKQQWCRDTHGLAIGPDDWIAEGICDMTSVDNLEMAGKAADPLPELVADVGYARPYRGDDKPQVEVSFRLANEGFVHHYGYGISKGPRQRATDDPRDKAVVPVSKYIAGLIRWIIGDHSNKPLSLKRELPVDFLNHCKAQNLGLTPKNYYRWSIEREHGPLARYKPETMYPRLLDHEEATLTDQGLKLGHLYFDLPADKEFQTQKAIVEFSGSRKALIYYDRNSTNQIYYISKGANMPVIRFPLAHVSRRFKNLSWNSAEIRFVARQGQTRETERLHAEHQMKVREATRKDAEQSLADVNVLYGDLSSRNRVAATIDIGDTKAAQIKAENDSARAAVEHHHPTQPAEPESVKTPKPTRPNIYE